MDGVGMTSFARARTLAFCGGKAIGDVGSTSS